MRQLARGGRRLHAAADISWTLALIFLAAVALSTTKASWAAEEPMPAPCAPSAPDWVRNAIHGRRRVALSDQSGIKVFVAEVPRDGSVPKATAIVWAEVYRKPRTSLEVTETRTDDDVVAMFDRISEASDLVLVNGGFWGYAQDQRTQIPLGLVVSKGRKVVDRIGWTSGGIVYATQSALRVAGIREPLPASGVIAALQSKPIVVANGVVDIRSETFERNNRTAVGVRRNGGRQFIVLAGAFAADDQGMSLCEFAQFLAIPRRQRGPAVTEALSMDGGPGAHLALPGARDARLRHFGVASVSYVPNVVRVRRRKER